MSVYQEANRTAAIDALDALSKAIKDSIKMSWNIMIARRIGIMSLDRKLRPGETPWDAIHNERVRHLENVVVAWRMFVDAWEADATEGASLEQALPLTCKAWKRHGKLIDSVEPDLDAISLPKDECDARGHAVLDLICKLEAELTDRGIIPPSGYVPAPEDRAQRARFERGMAVNGLASQRNGCASDGKPQRNVSRG